MLQCLQLVVCANVKVTNMSYYHTPLPVCCQAAKKRDYLSWNSATNLPGSAAHGSYVVLVVWLCIHAISTTGPRLTGPGM